MTPTARLEAHLIARHGYGLPQVAGLTHGQLVAKHTHRHDCDGARDLDHEREDLSFPV